METFTQNSGTADSSGRWPPSCLCREPRTCFPPFCSTWAGRSVYPSLLNSFPPKASPLRNGCRTVLWKLGWTMNPGQTLNMNKQPIMPLSLQVSLSLLASLPSGMCSANPNPSPSCGHFYPRWENAFHVGTLPTLPSTPELSIKMLWKRNPFMVFIFQREFPSTFQEGRIFREAACGEQRVQFMKFYPELFKAASEGLEVERRHGGGGECLPQ